MTESDSRRFFKCEFCGAPVKDLSHVLRNVRINCGICGENLIIWSWDSAARQPMSGDEINKWNEAPKDSHHLVKNAPHVFQAFRLRSEDYSEAIRPAVRAFTINVRRAAQSIMPFLFYTVGMESVDKEIREKSAKENRTYADVNAEMNQKCNLLSRAGYLGRKCVDESLRSPLGYGDRDEAVYAILSAQIIGIWTAFEALAEDLWVQCLNARPRLGFIALDAEPFEEDKEDDVKSKQNKRIPVPHWMLRDSKFDFSKSMGTLCREQKKWSFDRRDKACDAYCKVFAKDKELLAGLFNNNEIKLVAAVRNNLVHNAGIVDEAFQTLASVHPQFCNLEIGKNLPLTGDNVSVMTVVAVEKGMLLIDFIDNWLKSNPL